MGIFEEIQRVWITIDNRLYLWNYKTGDINTYDDQEQIIVTVGLVKPLPGVFLDQIQSVLVVATPVEIILLGLSFVNNKMTIYRTEMSVSADNVNMTQIVGTNQGRIFMRGNNGQLYELQYQAREGWITRKMRKINHSSSGLDVFVPSFLLWGSNDAVKSIALDAERNILYTVSKDSRIEMISLGVDGKGFTRLAKVSNLSSQIQRFSDYQQSTLDERHFQVVSIHPITLAESKNLCLLAVTSTGHRLYFAASGLFDRFMGNDSSTIHNANALQLIHVMGPPTLPGASQFSVIKVHEAFYSNGILLAAHSVSDEMDRIVGASPDSAIITKAHPKYLAESVSFVDIEGKAWAITSNTKNLKTAPVGFFLNELSTQFELLPTRFLILTNTGLSTVVKLRPMDLLLQLINSSQYQDIRAFQDFFNTFGKDQACAMALGIACSHTSLKTGAADVIPPHAITMATKLFFEMGGKPSINHGQHLQSGGFGVPLTTTEIQHSAKHNGLAFYLARLLRPLWKYPLVKKISFESQHKVEDLVSVQLDLQSLNNFLNQYRRFTAPPSPDTRPSGVDPEAWKTEQESLHAMHDLLHRSNEAISFLSLLIDYKIQNIIASLSETEKSDISNMTFESFVSTTKGRDLGRVLMTALVNKQIEKDIGADVITGILQQRCPTICQANDVVLYKGMELLQHARVSGHPEQQQNYLTESLKLFSSVIKQISFDKLKDIVENYKSLRFFLGIVDLVLLFASGIELAEDMQVTNEAYFKRIDSYDLLFQTMVFIDELPNQEIPGKAKITPNQALEMKAKVLQKSVASQDAFFHACLYDWFIRQGWIDQLLEISSSYLEEYLLREQGDLSKSDLLWRYYVCNSRFVEAAQVLAEIAHAPGLSLDKRLEYLTKAVANAKSSTDGGSKKELLSELTDALDVARIQVEIYQVLSARNDPDILQPLETSLLDVNELFHNFAKPYQMYEIILLILHTSDHGSQAKPLVESAWLEIIKKTLLEAQQNNRLIFDALSDKVKDLGRRFYPDENILNLLFLVNLLEQEGLKSTVPFDRSWLISSFVEVHIPFSKLFSTYHELFEAKIPPWSTNNALSYLIESISIVLKLWLDHVRSPSVPSYERMDFPARMVDEAISKYLVTIDSPPLVSKLHQIQHKVRSIF